MGIFDFLKSKPKASASIAKERLRIIVAQERSARGGPDSLPLLRRGDVRARFTREPHRVPRGRGRGGRPAGAAGEATRPGGEGVCCDVVPARLAMPCDLA